MAYTDSEWDPIINCTLNNSSHLEQLDKAAHLLFQEQSICGNSSEFLVGGFDLVFLYKEIIIYKSKKVKSRIKQSTAVLCPKDGCHDSTSHVTIRQ